MSCQEPSRIRQLWTTSSASGPVRDRLCACESPSPLPTPLWAQGGRPTSTDSFPGSLSSGRETSSQWEGTVWRLEGWKEEFGVSLRPLWAPGAASSPWAAPGHLCLAPCDPAAPRTLLRAQDGHSASQFSSTWCCPLLCGSSWPLGNTLCSKPFAPPLAAPNWAPSSWNWMVWVPAESPEQASDLSWASVPDPPNGAAQTAPSA